MAEYKRVLLKISGESLKGNQDHDIVESKALRELATTIKNIHEQGVEIGIVVGGGNIFRGRVSQDFGLERINADYMGMTATIINALVLKNIFTVLGIESEAMSCLSMPSVLEDYDALKANKLLEEGKVVIFGGGTGKPLLSTDTAAALRARDIHADVILAGKSGVDGIYDKDPKTHKDAKFLEHVTYKEYYDLHLEALDIEAIKICEANNIEIRVFNSNDFENMNRVVNGSTIGSYIRKEK